VTEEEGKEEEKKTLHTAAKEGKVDLVRTFLDKGESVNSENACNETPLHVAATKGNLDVMH
jgi:ankyrin repeat protein